MLQDSVEQEIVSRKLPGRLNSQTTSVEVPFPEGAGKRFVVARAEELAAGQRKIVTIKGREIGIFHVNGSYYALRNVCPHRSGPICTGRLRPLVVSPTPALYEVAHEREGEILKCPWHQWEFDIKTGQALYDETLRVKTFPVALEGDEIVVYL